MSVLGSAKLDKLILQRKKSAACRRIDLFIIIREAPPEVLQKYLGWDFQMDNVLHQQVEVKTGGELPLHAVTGQ